MREAGLDVSFDAGGNLYGRLPGRSPELPEVWSGSHLDTPPDGGRFDGALGVVAALDAAEAIAACGVAPIARSRSWPSGSRRVRASAPAASAAGPSAACSSRARATSVDADGISLGEAFAALGLGDLPTTGWLEPGAAAFVETHIEQGPLLAAQGARLGLVTSIAGMLGMEITFSGRRGHAGTDPMELRSDALAAAAPLRARRPRQRTLDPRRGRDDRPADPGPGATNTIPNRATLFADVRAPDDARLAAASRRRSSRRRTRPLGSSRCTVELGPRWPYPAQPMSELPMAALRRAISALGCEPVGLPSGAGHDAQILGRAGVPVAMLFVRSDAGGVSHAAGGADRARCASSRACRVLEPALRELMSA